MARVLSRRPPTAATRRTEEIVTTTRPRRPRPFWPWLLLLLLLVVGGLAALWYFQNRDETVKAEKIPNVVGLRQEAASVQLRERGFEVESERVVRPGQVGRVVSQRPQPGTLYGEGGIVVLSVARNPLRVVVPDVSGLPAARALTLLRANNLRPRAQAVPSREPRNQVLRQVPAAGTEVPRGSAAVVVVSSGPQLSTVPGVVGVATGEATRRLTARGFRTQVRRVPGSEPEGTVVAQNPPAGARALRNGVVRINVSNGPGSTTTTTTVVTTTTQSRPTVPDTVAQDEATATAALEGAGFRVKAVHRSVTDPSQDGIVISQTPRGGSAASPGTRVAIVVGTLQ